MNYANDPYWAYKGDYDAARRQAYESQVMADQVARDRHRMEADLAAVGVGAASLFFFSRKARQQKRERKEWCRNHPAPVNYGARRLEYERAVEALRVAGKATPAALDALKATYADIIEYDRACEERTC